jgi:predicted MFS family arabinose efflux permease
MDVRNQEQQPSARDIFTRAFVLGFLALFAFLAAYHSLTPTLPIYLAKLGSSEREIGVLVGIAAVASLVSRLIVGGALVRYSERSVMMVGALFSVLSFLAFATLRPFWPIFIARFFQGISFACLDTAVLAVVVAATPEKTRGQAIGYVLLASPLAMAMGASPGVFLSNVYGFPILFLSCAALSMVSVAFSSMVKKRRKFDALQLEPPTRSSRILDLNVVVPAVITFVNYFVGSALFTFVPLYGLERNIANPGFFFTAIAIMLFLGRIIGGRVLALYDKEKVISLFLFWFVAALIILASSHTLFTFVFAGIVWGTGLAFIVPASMAYALEYAGSLEGTAVGTYQMFMDSGMAVGPVIAGIFLPSTGYPVMFLCLAFICVINMGYFRFYVRRKKESRVRSA